MITEKQFKNKASDVSDSYDDFVSGLYGFSKDRGHIEEVYTYMVENPNAQTSDIIEYMDSLDGYLEPYVVVDDENMAVI